MPGSFSPTSKAFALAILSLSFVDAVSGVPHPSVAQMGNSHESHIFQHLEVCASQFFAQ